MKHGSRRENRQDSQDRRRSDAVASVIPRIKAAVPSCRFIDTFLSVCRIRQNGHTPKMLIGPDFCIHILALRNLMKLYLFFYSNHDESFELF
jgi:hypothetical protein